MICSRWKGVCSTALVASLVLTSATFAQIEVAEELLVDLDASHATAGEAIWENQGAMDDFERVGNPLVEKVLGVTAVTFNSTAELDAYRSLEPAPDGLVGLNPTRTIEVWVYNPQLTNEETLVAWGSRGGPDGTNMAFNYGTHGTFGAIGHWGGGDIGWNDAGGAPAAGQWHHLVYTYDGSETDEGDPTFTTRVYSDGCLSAEFCNEESLGDGVINTHVGNPIVLVAQLENPAGDLNAILRGALSLGRVRVHDGVLSSDQVLANFEAEEADFFPGAPPEFTGVPSEGQYSAGVSTYRATVMATGSPPPGIEAVAPAGATVSDEGVYSYDIPDPEPASFVATVRATNAGGAVEASWTVTRHEAPTDIEIAENLLVSVDAAHATAGETLWKNQGAMDDFEIVGNPLVEDILGVRAVTFNSTGELDAYRSLEPAPDGLIGLNPTRTIEVWAYNSQLAEEETLVAWGSRGGPNGSNMAFNYGTHGTFGAIGHWGGGDIGWDDAGGAPAASQWHHLVYTFDGSETDEGDPTFTTRVYSDGCLSAEFCNEEFLGNGIINTHAGTPIVLAAQLENTAGDLNNGPRGVLSLGRVRVHDGVLSADQVLANFEAEESDFFDPTPPGASLKPGDVNYDGDVNISDPVAALNGLFTGQPLPPCYLNDDGTPNETGLKVFDWNGDGSHNIADPVASLTTQFAGGAGHVLGSECVVLPGPCDDVCQ